MVGAAGGGAALGLLATLLFARTFEADAFGLFATLISAFSALASLAALGVDRLLLRHHARGEPVTVRRLLGPGLLVVLGTTLLGGLAIALLGPWLLTVDPRIHALGAVGFLAVALHPLAQAAFQARHRDLAVAAWSLTAPAGRLVGAVGAALLALPFLGFLTLFAVVQILVAAAAVGILLRWRRTVAAPEPGTAPALRPLLATGLPFAASGTLFAIYYQADILMLAALAEPAAAGHYKAAMVFIAAAYLVPAAGVQRFLLPRIFAWREAPDPLRRVRQVRRAALAYGLVAGGALAALAGPLIPLAYGPGYGDAIPALRLLALAVPFHCLAIAVGAFLVTEGDLRHKVRVQGALAVLNVALNTALIPYWGIQGAVLATVVTEILLAAGYVRLLRRGLRADGHAA